jgi:phosphate acetyltransferase
MKAKSLYIASLEKNSGSFVVSIGLMQYLKTKYSCVAFYRPIIERKKQKDNSIKTILKHFKNKIAYESCFGMYSDEAQNLIASNNTEKIYKKCLEDVAKLKKNYDFVLIEGLSKDALNTTIEFDINLAIAKNISSPIIAILNGQNKTIQQLDEEINIEAKSIKKYGCHHFITIVNRVNDDILYDCIEHFKDNEYIVNFLPEKKQLDLPSIKQIKDILGCEQIFGSKTLLQKQVANKKIAAMRVEHFIGNLKENDLVITPSDRVDVILALTSAYYSKAFANIAGIVLSGDLHFDENVMKILNGLEDLAIPILKNNDDTYTTAQKIDTIKAKITHRDKTKIATIIGMFSKYIHLDSLDKKLTNNLSDIVTPLMFKHSLLERSAKDKNMIVLPESLDERVLKAAEISIKSNTVSITLIGDETAIKNKATHFGIDISAATIINPSTSCLTTAFAKEFETIRKPKGITYEEAYDIMLNDTTYFATMMVHMGYADGMVSGAVNTTANTVRPALQIIKNKPDSDVVSSLFFMAMGTKVLVYADCAINTNPSAKELATIAIDSANNAQAFAIEPKIAMLSYSTSDSGSGSDVEKIKEATSIVKSLRPDLLIEGPIQYDAAIDKKIAKKKLPNSKIAGEATVFIFPDLNTGNNTYKAVRDSSGADAIGPILQGLNKPVNDLSRGCSVEDIVNTIAITSIQGAMQ